MMLIKHRRASTSALDRCKTLHEFQLNSVQEFKERPFIGTRGKDGTYNWVTYGDFGIQVDKFRHALLKQGIAPGDRVACISNNRYVENLF
jgi:long-chain acyl-CoA synthetase